MRRHSILEIALRENITQCHLVKIHIPGYQTSNVSPFANWFSKTEYVFLTIEEEMFKQHSFRCYSMTLKAFALGDILEMESAEPLFDKPRPAEPQLTFSIYLIYILCLL